MKILYEERGLYENIIDGVLCVGYYRQERLTSRTVGGWNLVQCVHGQKSYQASFHKLYMCFKIYTVLLAPVVLRDNL